MVAAITIPSLQNSTNNAEFKAAWKKAYAEISQTVLMMSENDAPPWSNKSDMRTSFNNYFEFQKIGNAHNIFEPYTGWNTNNNPYDSLAATINDGMALQFNMNYAGSSTCKANYSGLSNICGYITVDVNGTKGPNKTGTDVFGLWIIKENGTASTLPFGVNNSVDSMYCGGSSWNWFKNYAGCSANVLLGIDY